MIQKIKDKIIDYAYVISNQPVKLQELLSANSLLIEGMHLDGKKLGFRLKLGRAYVIFLVLIKLLSKNSCFVFFLRIPVEEVKPCQRCLRLP